MPGDEELLQRLLSDPAFRARYLAGGGDAPLESLAARESRSSLAGAMLGVAVEGVALFGLADHAEAAVEQLPSVPSLPSLPPVLENHNLAFDADGIADLRAGRIDPRVQSVLEHLSREHKITISSMRSDHSRLTAGGSVSNHSVGRAFDIAAIDGVPVGPGNEAAKQMALELAKLDPSIRPTEIGSPWVLEGAAYFTDADHQDHLHVGFDDPPAEGWTPPADDAAPPAATPEDAPDADDGDDSGDSDADDSGGDADDSGGDSEDSDDDEDDSGDTREDGGSGDTEAEADDDEDDGDDDEEDEEDDEDDEDEEEDEDEDEEDEDERGPDQDDLEDPDRVGSPAGDTDEADADTDEADTDETAADADSGVDAAALADTGGPYPGAEARKEDLAAWMAAKARERGLPSELPIMASLVESGLSNLNFGDADSVGFFQMRTGIWNQGAYAGYPEKPELQLKWFLDQAESVMKQRVSRGLPIDDPNHFGEWIADIERPAEQYRGRYQLRLGEARGLLERVVSGVQKLRVITPEEAARARGG
jgi:hypothetical protein